MKHIKILNFLVLAALYLFYFENALFAEVSLDGTISQSGILSGPDYQISSDLGQQSGTNLFHSFLHFNLNQGETAVFSGPDSVNNIIARVTGGELSTINGGLISDIPDANLFLLNPAGFVFGLNAYININGSFYTSTANFLSFEDHKSYGCIQSDNSILTSAAPVAFGFLTDTPCSIKVTGDLKGNPATNLALVGGNIEINGKIEIHQGGQLSLLSTNSSGITNLTGTEINDFSSLGTISLGKESAVVSSGQHPASISIRAGNLIIDHAALGMYNTGAEDDGMIDIYVSDDIQLNNGELKTFATEKGNGGTIKIESKNIILNNKSEIFVSTYGISASGDIKLSTSELRLDDQSMIGSYTSGLGGSGTIDIDSELLSLKSGSSILTITDGDNMGGEIQIRSHDLSLTAASQIGTIANNSGPAGHIQIDAAQSIVMAGKNEDNFKSGLFSQTTGNGSNGIICVDTDTLHISDSGQIFSARNKNAGPSQNINLTAGSIFLESNATISGGNIDIETDTLHIANGGYIWGQPVFQEITNTINIHASESISIKGEGESLEQWRDYTHPLYTGIHTDVFINSNGHAGDIMISSPTITIENSGQIGARTYTDGSAGDIDLQTDSLVVKSGGQIGTDSFGSTLYNGSAGNITISANETIQIEGGIGQLPSGFFSRSRSEGNSGFIQVNSPFLTIADGGSIAVNTGLLSYGDAGKISIKADYLDLNHKGSISSQAGGTGTQGFINILADMQITMDDSKISSLGTYSGTAGDILVETPLMNMSASTITTKTETHHNGGAITILTNDLYLNNDSLITSSSSDRGDAGTITIKANSSLNLRDSAISTETVSADGGNIILNATHIFYLINSDITTTVIDDVGDGGNINIDPTFVILDNSNIMANAYQGAGGKIKMVADYFFPDVFSTIEASSELGIDGEITIETPNIDLGSSFAILPGYRIIPDLVADSCESKTNASSSSLISSGQGNLPFAPYDPLISLSTIRVP